jgi:hypothetical protein
VVARRRDVEEQGVIGVRELLEKFLPAPERFGPRPDTSRAG